MLKELRYLFYILIIFLFLFLTLQFYFSDTNKKKSYRSFKEIDDKIIAYSQKLILLKLKKSQKTILFIMFNIRMHEFLQFLDMLI